MNVSDNLYRRRKKIAAVLLAALAVLAVKEYSGGHKKDFYTVSVPAYWGTIIPPLQHSIVGYGVMINQFEPLVRRGKNGLLEPMGAKAWAFSDDRRTLRFTIDVSRRFSDGSQVTAADFKRSWEEGLRMRPKSSNSSLSDALSEVKGFGEREKNGGISGIRAVGADTLELEFGKPVRSILEQLSSVRYAAYKQTRDGYIGTGPYVMAEKEKVLTLVPNEHYQGPSPKIKKLLITIVPPGAVADKLRSGEIDAALFAERAGISDCDEENINCTFGQEGSHSEMMLNGMPGRFFSDPRRRAAMQALLWGYFKNNREEWPPVFRGNGFFLDPQSYLRFQAGRLPDAEAEAVIAKGAPYLDKLAADSKKNPLVVCSAPNSAWLAGILEKNGISISKKSKSDLPEKDVLGMFYKTQEPDMIPLTISVYDGDPDSLYHLLGKHGSIFSPMVERGAVADMLESGRKIMDPGGLAPHYMEVSRRILQEVPYVHLGYFYRAIAYNPKRVRVSEKFMSRNNQSVAVFEPKGFFW